MSREQDSWPQRLKGVFFESDTSVDLTVGAEEFAIRLGQLEVADDIDEKSLRMILMKTTELLRKEPRRLVELNPDVPTIVVPDLHARRDYLGNVLAYRMDGLSVLEAMEQGKINVVCLGDGMHSENPANWKGDQREELVRSVNLMQMVMELKLRFPNNFHYLRGNHDDIKNDDLKRGDIFQNAVMRALMNDVFNSTFIDNWHQFERQLPLMALLKRNDGSAVIMTHAAPAAVVTPGDMSTKPIWSRNDQLFFDLTWTENMRENRLRDPNHWVDTADIGNFIRETAQAFGILPERIMWIVGHRNVYEYALCRVQCGGQLIQIADPYRRLVYPIPVSGELTPRSQVISL